MTRRTVRVEVGGNTATLTGPRLRPALERSGSRWMWHPFRHHREGAMQVPLADLDDLLAALEIDGQHIEMLDRYGDPMPYGGLLGVAS